MKLAVSLYWPSDKTGMRVMSRDIKFFVYLVINSLSLDYWKVWVVVPQLSQHLDWVQIDKNLPKGIAQTKKIPSDIETIDQFEVGGKKWEVLQLDGSVPVIIIYESLRLTIVRWNWNICWRHFW